MLSDGVFCRWKCPDPASNEKRNSLILRHYLASFGNFRFEPSLHQRRRRPERRRCPTISNFQLSRTVRRGTNEEQGEESADESSLRKERSYRLRHHQSAG